MSKRNLALHVVDGAIADTKDHNAKFDYQFLSQMWDQGEIYIRTWDEIGDWSHADKKYIPCWLWGQVIKGTAWARNMDQLPPVVQMYATLIE